MNSFRVCFAVLGCAALTGCAAPQPTASTAEPSTVWYSGTVAVSSADGATPYGPPKQALVARTVDKAHNLIVEVVVDDGVLRTTTLQREGDSNVFSATDNDKTFSGKVMMTGEGWNISGWTYDLAMADGSGRIAGTATVDASGIQTEKHFVTPDGRKKVRIADTLTPISKAEYDAKLAGLLGKP